MIEEFSARTRAANLESMVREPLDVLVIGGGIVGAWTALSASAQGYRTGLVERSDFASGTSGKTSRLVHGGLRYLQQLRLGLVREAARERDVLPRLIPDLVKPITFLIPVYGDRGPKGWQLRIGLWLYDSVSRDKVLPRRRWLTREEALRREAGLNPRGLVRAATYADAITSDARLVLRVVQTAASAGVLVANYASVEELIREGGRVRGARVLDEVSGRRIAVRATVVVNATGVWVGELQEPTHRLRLRPTKGAHILVPRRRIGNTGAVTLPTRDGRVVFVLPWGALSLVGTTDTDYRGLREEPEPDGTDVEYLLGAANEGFPDARLSAADVVSAYAGLRPLIDSGERRESDISRRHDIIVDPDGLVSVAGGKLTTARAMSMDVVHRIGSFLPTRFPRPPPPSFGPLAEDEHRNEDLRAKVAYAARNEMAIHIEDVLIRRTGMFYEREDQGAGVADEVADVLGRELEWSKDRRAGELARFRTFVEASGRWRAAPRG